MRVPLVEGLAGRSSAGGQVGRTSAGGHVGRVCSERRGSWPAVVSSEKMTEFSLWPTQVKWRERFTDCRPG